MPTPYSLLARAAAVAWQRRIRFLAHEEWWWRMGFSRCVVRRRGRRAVSWRMPFQGREVACRWRERPASQECTRRGQQSQNQFQGSPPPLFVYLGALTPLIGKDRDENMGGHR